MATRTNKYFATEASGLNADIERHRKEEQMLLARIKELEAISSQNSMEVASLRTYKNFLAILRQSKAEVLSKLGH